MHVQNLTIRGMIQHLIPDLYLWNLIHYTSMDRMFLFKWDIWYTIDWGLKVHRNLMVCTMRGIATKFRCCVGGCSILQPQQLVLLMVFAFLSTTCVPLGHDFNYCCSSFFVINFKLLLMFLFTSTPRQCFSCSFIWKYFIIFIHALF